MKRQRLFHLAVLYLLLTCAQMAAQQPATVNLRPRIIASDPGTPSVHVIVDKPRVPLGTEVLFTVLPPDVVKDSRYTVTLYFGDGEQSVMRTAQVTHLYWPVGTYTYSVLVRHTKKSDDDQPPRVTLLANPVPAEPGQQVQFAAQLSKSDPDIQYRFVYGDGSSSDWQTSGQAEHAYGVAGTYSAYVDIRDRSKRIGGSVRKRVDVTAPPSATVFLNANPLPAVSGRPVTFSARVSPVRANTQYRFEFGDGGQTMWQAGAQAQHAYKAAGTYRAHVQISQSDNNRKLTATSAPTVVPVQRSPGPAPTPIARPTPRPDTKPTPTPTPDASPSPTVSPSPSGSPSPGDSQSPIGSPSSGPIGATSPSASNMPSQSSSDNPNQNAGPSFKWLYLLLAALFLFLIYQATGYLFAAKPTFTAFSDPGVSSLADEKGLLPLDFQMVLIPNVSTGQYSISTDEPRLVKNADKFEDRQVLEI